MVKRVPADAGCVACLDCGYLLRDHDAHIIGAQNAPLRQDSHHRVDEHLVREARPFEPCVIGFQRAEIALLLLDDVEQSLSRDVPGCLF